MRCSHIVRVLQTMARHARAHASQEQRLQLAALGLAAEPPMGDSSPAHTSQSSRNKGDYHSSDGEPDGSGSSSGSGDGGSGGGVAKGSSQGMLDGGGLQLGAMLACSNAVPEECFQELSRQSRCGRLAGHRWPRHGRWCVGILDWHGGHGAFAIR